MSEAMKRPSSEDRDGSSSKRQKQSSAPAGFNNQDVIAKAKAAAAKRKAEIVAKKIADAKAAGVLASNQPKQASPTTAPPPQQQHVPGSSSGLLDRIRQRKAALASSQQRQERASPSRAEEDDFQYRPRGGLNVGVHPLLAGDASSLSTGGNRPTARGASPGQRTRTKSPRTPLDLSTPQEDETKNPYYDASLSVKALPERKPRSLVFHQKGVYIEQAKALRAQAKLEELKRKIQQASKSAGIESEFDITERAFKKEEPPAVEWWDEALVTNNSYDDLDDEKLVKVDTPDSIVTLYVQHPVPIPAPWERHMPTPKPPHLTKKEMKRIRKTDRSERFKEQQDRVRLGLDPAPPPKVKLSNLMSVLTNEAIKDPTLVEARVRKEVEERKLKHELDNANRKLTSEERTEKDIIKAQEDENKGIFCAVFLIDYLWHPQHRYKVSINAQQAHLKGITLLNPKFNIVIVEGGHKSINFYKKLMLNRIKWNEAAAPLKDDVNIQNDKDLSHNKCQLIWQGEIKQHNFKRWSTNSTETEIDAREMLSRYNCDNFWSLAKSIARLES